MARILYQGFYVGGMRGTLVYDSSALSLPQIREVTHLLITSHMTLTRPIRGLLSYFRRQTIEQNKPLGSIQFRGLYIG